VLSYGTLHIKHLRATTVHASFLLLLNLQNRIKTVEQRYLIGLKRANAEYDGLNNLGQIPIQGLSVSRLNRITFCLQMKDKIGAK
jgi:hypothetical protein